VHPRFVQAVVTAFVLLGFVAGIWAIVPFAALVLVAQLLAGPRFFGPEDERAARLSVVAEVVLLATGTVLFVAGHSGWGWALAFVAALLSGMAAVAEVWLRPPRDYVRRPQ
jgi:hypothetical protein